MTDNEGSSAHSHHTSLTDYAAARPRTRACLVCNASDEVRRQLESAKGTVSYPLMVEWLRDEHGYADVTRGKIEKHWQHRHGDLA